MPGLEVRQMISRVRGDVLTATYESGDLGLSDPAKASELRMQAQCVDPRSADQSPLPMLRQGPLASHAPFPSIAVM